MKEKHMTYLIVIEKTKRNFGAYCPDVPGCAVTAKTEPEIVRLMKEVLEMQLVALSEIPPAVSRFEDIPQDEYEPGSWGEYVEVRAGL